MDYKDTTEFLYSLYRHGIKLGLDSISSVLQALGNPHQHYESVHIGGTNGKGSTAAIVAHILQASGLRVGLYTSPHLVDFRERIRINGKYISATRVIDLTQRLQSITPTPPTFFEFTTAMALTYFDEEQVDIAVIEVGMGGRFDATNVISPCGVVLTTIAHDHQQYLGDTLSEIAFEKAGIIKPGKPVVLGEMPSEASAVILDMAVKKGAPCYALGSEFHIIPESTKQFRYDGIDLNYSGLSSGLEGIHQMKNAGCALALLERMDIEGVNIPESTIRSSLASVRWEGRVEVLAEGPKLVLDGAHNPASAKVLADTLVSMIQDEHDSQLILIVGMMQDKDCKNFMEMFRQHVGHLILTQVSVQRSATVADLRKNVSKEMAVIHEANHPVDALALAKRLARSCDVICVTGSLFLVGELRNHIKGASPSFS